MPAMPAPPQTTEAEWEMYKAIIEKEYLTMNKPAEVVQRQLKTQYGFNTTTRRLKLRFDLWNWNKKIPALHYAAMVCVIQDVGQNVDFIVPKMGGRTLSRVEAKKVIKESHRKKSNNEQKGKPPPLALGLEAAYKILHDAGITYEPRLATNGSQAPSNRHRPADLQGLAQDPIDQPYDENSIDDDEDDDNDYDDSSIISEWGDELTSDADIIQEESRYLDQQNFPPGLRFRRHQASPPRPDAAGIPRKSGVLPFTAAYMAVLHCDIFPQIEEYNLADPAIVIARHHERHIDVVSDPDYVTVDSPDDLGLSGLDLNTTQRVQGEKLIQQALSEHYQRHDPNEHRRKALEFSAYYANQALAGLEVLDDYNHADRNEARNKLRVMLEQKNMQLLTHCYWVSSMLMSYDKIRLLLGFLEDCADCIETSTSYLGTVLRPWIRLMVLSYRNDYRCHPAKSPRLSPAALEEMEMHFDASQQLKESMDCLSQHGHGESHTHFILRLCHAWNTCHQGREDPTGGQIELLECLKVAPGKFGQAHLVTINCLSMVARTYEKLNNPEYAKYYVGTALIWFPRTCSKMLEPRYYQLELSDAQLLLAEGKLLEAREKLERVVHYRVQHFGLQTPITWYAAEMLFDAMSRLGFGHEAQQQRTELTARFEQEWRQNPTPDEWLPRL